METHAQAQLPLTQPDICTALELRPICSREGHGFMQLRPIVRQTYEQKFCGVWYDCGKPYCHASVLYPSAGLKAQWAAMGHGDKLL